jgi:hypothetical protein
MASAWPPVALLAVTIVQCGLFDLCAGPSNDVVPGLEHGSFARDNPVVTLVHIGVFGLLVAARVVAEFMGCRGDRANDRAEPAPKLASNQEMLIPIRWSSRQSG